MHLACRSGRVESVKLLLQAGASVNTRDKDEETPLHACADFNKRRIVWPEGKETHKVVEDDGRVQITEIISLLVAHGADPFARNNNDDIPVDLSIENNNSEMAVALAHTRSSTPKNLWPGPEKLYLTAEEDRMGALLDGLIAEPQDMMSECEKLLDLRAYRILEQLAARGVKFYEESTESSSHRDFLRTVAQRGFTRLFETLGRARGECYPDWINGNMSSPNKIDHGLPFIFIAARCASPNLDLLRVVVEVFNADINVRTHETVFVPSLDSYESGHHHSVLHILAAGDHWWQTEAIEYLLNRGADVTMRDVEGRTSLHTAVLGGYRRLGIARLLLEHGADPNACDRAGVTPLGLIAGKPEIARLLIQHGAKLELGSKDLLFEAITNQDIDTV